jgi:hypothetical protein
MTQGEQEKKRGSWLSLLLAGSLTLIVIAGLFFLTLGWIGPVILLGAGVFALAAFHYLVWGWWLSKIIRDEEEAKSARRSDGSDWPQPRLKP